MKGPVGSRFVLQVTRSDRSLCPSGHFSLQAVCAFSFTFPNHHQTKKTNHSNQFQLKSLSFIVAMNSPRNSSPSSPNETSQQTCQPSFSAFPTVHIENVENLHLNITVAPSEANAATQLFGSNGGSLSITHLAGEPPALSTSNSSDQNHPVNTDGAVTQGDGIDPINSQIDGSDGEVDGMDEADVTNQTVAGSNKIDSSQDNDDHSNNSDSSSSDGGDKSFPPIDKPTLVHYLNGDAVYSWQNYPYWLNSHHSDAPIKFFVEMPPEEEVVASATNLDIKFGYHFLHYSRDKGRKICWSRNQCLGVHICTTPGCKFTDRPIRPEKKGREVLPPPSKKRCPQHPDLPLKHVKCQARTAFHHDVDGYVCVYVQDGHTDHPHPPQPFASLPPFVKSQLQDKIVEHRNVGASALIMGTPHRSSTSQDHPGHDAVANRDAIRQLRTQMMKSSGPQQEDPAYQVAASYAADREWVQSCSVHESDFHFAMQDKECRKAICENTGAFEVDAVEGFLKMHSEFRHLKGNEASAVTITSIFNKATMKWRPVLITPMGGKSALHYRKHFKVLFDSLKVEQTYNNFVHNFPGVVSDFSQAQAKGFFAAAKDYVRKTFGKHVTVQELRKVLKVRYCEVHFKRSLHRLSRESSLVPPEQQKEFVVQVLRLLQFQFGDIEKFFKHFLEVIRKFTLVGEWLKWHLKPGVATILFPACREFDDHETYQRWSSRVPNNTNAAEAMNGLYQRNWGKSSIGFKDCLDWTKHFLKSFSDDNTRASRGAPMYYGMYKANVTTKKRKRRSVGFTPSKRARAKAANDHRGPDTAQRIRAMSRATPHASEQNWQRDLPQLRWGVNYAPSKRHPLRYPAITDTCALDTPLTFLYIMWHKQIIDETKLLGALKDEVVEALQQIRQGNTSDSRRNLYSRLDLLEDGLHEELYAVCPVHEHKNISAFVTGELTILRLFKEDKIATLKTLIYFNKQKYEQQGRSICDVLAEKLKTIAHEEISEDGNDIHHNTFLLVNPIDDVDLLRTKRFIAFTDIPTHIELDGICSLYLRMVAFGNGAHYMGMMYLQLGKWLYYDDLGLGVPQGDPTKRKLYDLSPQVGEVGWDEWKRQHTCRNPVYALYEVVTKQQLVNEPGLLFDFVPNAAIDPVEQGPHDTADVALATLRTELEKTIKESGATGKQKANNITCGTGWQIHDHMPTRRKCAGCKLYISKGATFFSHKLNARSKPYFVHRVKQCVELLPEQHLSSFNRFGLKQQASAEATTYNLQTTTTTTATATTPKRKIKPALTPEPIHWVDSPDRAPILAATRDADVNVPFYLSNYEIAQIETAMTETAPVITPAGYQTRKNRTELYLTKRELLMLKKGQMLNDEVINAFLRLLEDAFQRDGRNEYCMLSTQFATTLQLKRSGWRNTLRKMTRYLPGPKRLDERQKVWETNWLHGDSEIIFVPMNMDNIHWTCGFVDVPKRTFSFYCSMGGEFPEWTQLREYVEEEYLRLNDLTEKPTWKVNYLQSKDQKNCVDCGVFICLFIHLSLKDFGITISQELAHRYRGFMALCLLHRRMYEPTGKRKKVDLTLMQEAALKSRITDPDTVGGTANQANDNTGAEGGTMGTADDSAQGGTCNDSTAKVIGTDSANTTKIHDKLTLLVGDSIQLRSGWLESGDKAPIRKIKDLFPEDEDRILVGSLFVHEDAYIRKLQLNDAGEEIKQTNAMFHQVKEYECIVEGEEEQ